jgi:hypothetical protein
VSAARAIASARRDGEPQVLCLQELHGVRADRVRAGVRADVRADGVKTA